MVSINEIERHVIDKLNRLPPDLTYHNTGHTLDVLQSVHFICAGEGLCNSHDLFILQVSALYHDTGFAEVYNGHEEVSCRIAQEELANFGLSANDIQSVCNTIRATKVPQLPMNFIEKIICDADLDYLGRNDFWKIAEGLYQEFLSQKVVNNLKEWNELQVRFLESHRYFTRTSQQCRAAQKELHLRAIRQKLTDTRHISH